MPPPNKRWQRGKKRPRERHVRRLLILCEDEKSSRDYFEQFPYDPTQVVVECVGTGYNTDTLMEEAIRRKVEAEDLGEPYLSVWVVFDRDSFPLQRFNRAFDLARGHGDVEACWSNECFEIWYLLHFGYRDTAIGRRDIYKELTKRLGENYEKCDREMFNRLKPLIDDALANAARLAQANGAGPDQRPNPSTRVHELVDLLRGLDPENQ